MTEPIAFTATRYRCPHCRRGYSQKAAAVKHLARCFRNPAVRSCKSCRFYEPPDETGFWCTQEVNLQVQRCSTCGDELRMPDGECSCPLSQPYRKPVFGLRVQCPEWEATE